MKYLGHYLAGATVGLVQGSPVCLHLPVTLRWYGSPGLKWAPGGITSVCVCACVCGVHARARERAHMHAHPAVPQLSQASTVSRQSISVCICMWHLFPGLVFRGEMGSG